MTAAVSDRTIQGLISSSPVIIPDSLGIIDNPSEPVDATRFGMFRIMTAKDGDKRVVWRKESIPEIHAAKEMFDQLVQEGMVPYCVGRDGQATTDVMSEFDPSAEEVIFMPMRAVVGG